MNENSPRKLHPNAHHQTEIGRLNARRGPRRKVRWIRSEGETGDALEPHPPGIIFDHSGLALSGGGIRSAAFCLGAIQALASENRLSAIDYLSTVSGGGYVGCSLTASLSATGVFPFATQSTAPGVSRDPVNELQDSNAVQHIRDYSNYLMPRGLSDLTLSIGVVLRGLVASASLVLGPILLLAGIVVWLHPSIADLKSHDAFGICVENLAVGHFVVSTSILLVLIVYLFVWGLARSRDEAHGGAPYEFTSAWPRTARWLLRVLVIVVFLEAQPLAELSLLSAQSTNGGAADFLFGKVVGTLAEFAKYLAPIAGIITFLAGRIGDLIKANTTDPTWTGQATKLVSQTLLLLAAIVVPLLVWLGWLYLVLWGTGRDPQPSPLAGHLPPLVTDLLGNASVPVTYLVAGGVIFIASCFMEPNANSLHRLYRDRLSDAFLFLTRQGTGPAADSSAAQRPLARTRHNAAADTDTEVKSLDSISLSRLDTDRCPYLLINTALNIQGSPYVNKRGRNADFFIFSRDFVGSHATGFVPTVAMESKHPSLDLGTAMAISGAAASSNMGSDSIRILAPTLALLNVRLGYWLPNPARMADVTMRASPEPAGGLRRSPSYVPPSFYLFAEMFSLLDENSEKVYLTDGGHIENLGVYELLKRRCRFILAIDAEADPSYTFSSFVTLQRYARIDLGIRIDELPWQQIRARSRENDRDVVAANLTGAVSSATSGCHAAIGRIDYPDAPAGILLYIKSSMTGDENDLIQNYKVNNPGFPHETTGDQFFGEAQFEAYRALGFHALKRVLAGEDRIPGLIASAPDGAPLPGQDDAEAKEQRKAMIDRIFNDSSVTGAILARS